MSDAWHWLSQYHGAISAVASVLTLLVWLFYFQLLWSSYHHRMRAKILIAWGGGISPDARCIITNMSEQPVYLQAIMIELDNGEHELLRSLSDHATLLSDATDPRRQLLQGPLASGEMLDIGSFRDLLRAGDFDSRPGESGTAVRLKITIFGTYTSEDAIVAVERQFEIAQGRISSPTPEARHIRSRTKRREYERMLSKAE